jgi:hypothetical protein
MESRLKKSIGTAKGEDRESDEAGRETDDKLISNQERLRMWRDELTQSALPKLPKLDGWHLCWLSTTNAYDTIDQRTRLGYVPVKADELPGYKDNRVKSAEHVGFISCNEMLLFKLPMDLYQDLMKLNHHDIPREEAEKIKTNPELLQRDSSGRLLGSIEGDGIGSIDKKPNQTPVFSG